MSIEIRQVLDVTKLQGWHVVIEEGDRCAHCGDKFEVGDGLVCQPSAWLPDVRGAIEPTHDHCAVKDGYALRYEGEPGWDGDS